MITIYTTPSCSSCRKAKKWLDEHKVPYEEKNLFNHRIDDTDIEMMLNHAENGFDDIISTRSKVFKEQELEVEDMSVSELKSFIINHPSVLKRPIIVDAKRMQVGYNDEEIRVFIPKRLREMIMRENSEEDFTHYDETLSRYFATMTDEIDDEE
ncbi:Regulatory protein spx [Acholeplasma oculi]|uniref:Arsenate reductase ArsC n=1 Tax=Acholeplasma oculi TaxID=35623 RepID=A0A061AHC9_9MOLU|nr:transcriptional regulator Spx [Acholeplasma oculi]CDR30387.1 Arsenate reductase ArsC [Acholeplasma oculi]SKC41937.1 regulatory protein spx [Acholeplasma oculi]SUT88915.1 Regulatory protein spx [Acholeplasma oculi]